MHIKQITKMEPTLLETTIRKIVCYINSLLGYFQNATVSKYDELNLQKFTVYTFLTNTILDGVCTEKTIIFSPLINTSLSNQQATFLWMKESSLMKIYPHFLMIKSDGSIHDISKFNRVTFGYSTNTDSNIETHTTFMMTNDMTLYACNYKTGTHYTYNINH